ncbi:unnamed protein product, partial [Ixodes hexagonus]
EPGDALTGEDDKGADDSEGALSAQVSVGNIKDLRNVSPISSPRFLELQKNDDTLKVLWDQAEMSTHGMIVEGGLLFHREEVNGGMIRQRLLPLEKRQKLLEMG